MTVAERTTLASYFNEDNTFSQNEMQDVMDLYVCPVCHGDLAAMWVPDYHRVVIHCPEHGNVCYIGRITKNTVSISLDKAFRDYHLAIRNLPDLWGHLAQAGFDRTQALKITKYYVCAVCGKALVLTARQDHPKMDIVDIGCQSHGNINDTGYVKHDQFVYDFQRMRAWEKEHKK